MIIFTMVMHMCTPNIYNSIWVDTYGTRHTMGVYNMSRETRKMARAAALHNVMVDDAGVETKLTAEQQLANMPSMSELRERLAQIQREWDIVNDELTLAKAQIKRHTTLRVQIFKMELRDADM